MKLLLRTTALILLGFCMQEFTGYAQEIRDVSVVIGDAQENMVSKLYEMKYVRAADIAPYISAAVKRYNTNSLVRRINYHVESETKLLVTTGENFMPYVDELIAKLDRPGKKDEFGSIIEGTGIYRISYTPRYRATKDLAPILQDYIGSGEGSVYINPQTNIIMWQDEYYSALDDLNALEHFDRPLPQVRLRINYYEVRESTLRDMGFDYLAWKNGPGLNFLNIGYNAGKIVVDDMILGAANAVTFSESWNYGGFFSAPQLDLSFIRLLQQSGAANISESATLTMLSAPIGYVDENGTGHIATDIYGSSSGPVYDELKKYQYSISMVPEYQNIEKDAVGVTTIGAGTLPELEMTFYKPVVCFPTATGVLDESGHLPTTEEFYMQAKALPNNGGVILSYEGTFKNVVERGSNGAELANATSLYGGLTLGFENEKILTVYEQTNDVEQTIGLPFFSKLPVLKYLFSTETTIQEHTYIVITAEASLIHPALSNTFPMVSVSQKNEMNLEQ